MKLCLILFVGFLWVLPLQAQILPSIFYQSRIDQKAFCQTKPSANEIYKLMKDKLESHPNIQNARGLKKDVMRNLLVTWSYAELLRLNQSQDELGARAVGVMGHVYSNASHHLGRLVRFRYWDQLSSTPSRNTIKLSDRSLVSGGLLGRAVETMPELLSHRLMKHSLDLYETLSWVLGSVMLCGPQYTIELVEEYQCGFWGNCDILPGLRGLGAQLEAIEHLKNALKIIQKKRFLRSAQLQEWANAFVRFEQFYLQHTMYNQIDVGTSASLGLLDEMRFIPFEGIKSQSFKSWCAAHSTCQGSSKNLEQRILFDQSVISQEIAHTLGSLPRMSLRDGHHMIRQVRLELLDN